MTREVSIFLDIARFAAAYLVFLSHTATNVYTGGLLWQISGLGREAVDIFFVLSGFVIAHVTASRERTARDYAVNRLARIASVALPALALTWILDTIGISARPGVYAGFCCDTASAGLDYARNLLFLGDVWAHHVSPGSNVPYWSLGYEAWYYLAFGLFTFLPRRLGLPAAFVALALAGPGIAILFPLWLLGAACYRRGVTAGRGWWLMVAGTFGGLAVCVLGVRQGNIYSPFAFEAGRMLDYAHDYAMGLSFAAFLVGFRAVSLHFAVPLRAIERPVRWLAGGTFAFYLFHVPLLRFVAAVMPFPTRSWPTMLAVYAGVPLAVFALAEVTERRKAWWRGGVARLFARVA